MSQLDDGHHLPVLEDVVVPEVGAESLHKGEKLEAAGYATAASGKEKKVKFQLSL